MSGHRDPPHYLKRLKTTTTPKRLLWLDCAAEHVHAQGVWVDRWSVGALGSTRYTSKRGERRDDLQTHTQAVDLWRTADTFCIPGRRTVMFAYDLSYQLRLSQALVHLPLLGWELRKIVLERTAAWAELRSGDRTLLCCDLRSWCPTGIGGLERGAGVLPAHPQGTGAPFPLLANLCRRRAETVREAALDLLAWVDREGLGPFRPTGSGQGYAAYRRRFMSRQLLVHDNVQQLADERAAMWTGRCEAWQHGHLTDGPYVEYDMRAAYCTIAAECDIPEQAVGTMTRPTAARLLAAMDTHSVMAKVRVTTDVPCVPAFVGTRMIWPVGTFTTWLYDPELRIALEQCESVTCEKAWKYRRGPALRDFATWVLEGMSDVSGETSDVVRKVLKHWSRSLVGRMGLRYRSWEKFGTSPLPDLRLVTFLDTEEGIATDMLCAGYDRLLLTAMAESSESLPQIPGWIMSECRRRLWAMMQTVGLDNVVYVDTDSIIVAPCELTAKHPISFMFPDAWWSNKGAYRRMTVHGPRNLTCQSTRRVAGLPLTARQVAPLQFEGTVMRSIKESMRAGELDSIASVPRTFKLSAVDLRRQHLPNGKTAPFRLES